MSPMIGELAAVDGKQRVTAVEGELNIPLVQRYANLSSAIRRGLPQVRAHVPTAQRICLVGSGPSLESTLPELQKRAWAGQPLIAMNGSYEWLIDHHFKPSAMVLIDGRDFNARFLTEQVAGCRYFLASQCHPKAFEKVRGWPDVYLWHCLIGDDPAEKALLDDYYLKAWQPIAGGSTVMLRAIVLMRTLGYSVMDCFGFDSCYLDGQGHAVPQPENDRDGTMAMSCAGRTFACASWHAAQYLEFLQLVQANGHLFTLAVHGDGLIAHAVRALADESDTTVESLRLDAAGA